MTRRAALAAVFLLYVAGIAAAQTQADPVAYIRSIYRAYTSLPYNKVPAFESLTLSPRLRALSDADRKEAQGEVGRLDFDPMVNGQDWKLSALKVTLVSRAGDGAVVDAAFRNIDTDEHLRFSLVRQQGRWAIDEIQSLQAMRWTLSKILEGAPDAYPDAPTTK